MKKTNFQKILLVLGIVILLVSVVFLIISLANSGRYKVDCDKTVDFIKSILPDSKVGMKEERSNSEMPSVYYDGQDFSALISIPRFSVTLPVRSSWNKYAVKEVPCRFTGNTYDGSLIVGGTDSKDQFDFVSEIDIGDTVLVTDMRGYEFTYSVSTVKHAKDAKAETLMDSDVDLILFAKDKKSGDWLLVKCIMQ